MLNAAEIASMTDVVAGSLDVSLPFYHNPKGPDTYGHTTDTSTNLVGTFPVNVIKPSATQLQIYADIIGSQTALMLRFMSTSDIKEGYTTSYQGKTWCVNFVETAESYSFANECLITTVV